MSVFEAYPVPSARKREPSDNVWQAKKPGTNKNYSPGRKAGTRKWVPMHGGNDIYPSSSGLQGERVNPVARGVIVGFRTPSGAVYGEAQGWGSAYGGLVIIRHRLKIGGRWKTRYTGNGHMKNLPRGLELGNLVSVENRIGDLGKTGYTTGPHVHFIYQTTPNHKDGVLNPHDELEAVR